MKRAAEVVRHPDGPRQPLNKPEETVSTALPFRSRCRNIGTAIAAPAAVRLIASRATGQDATTVCLQADLSDLTAAAQRRHAVRILDALAAKWPGHEVDVQLVDGDNVPLFCATQGGAA